MLVSLRSADAAALNAFCAERGIYLSHLALRSRTLEEMFLELTRDAGAPAMGGIE